MFRGFAIGDWAGYSQCNIKDCNGYLAGKCHYYWSSLLIHVTDKSKEDEMQEEIMSQRKWIEQFMEALARAQISNKTLIAKTPVAVSFNPQEETD